MSQGFAVSQAESQALSRYISELEEAASEIQSYKNHLTRDIARFAGIIMPSVNTKQFTESCKSMDLDSLKKLRDDMLKQAGEIFPVTSQLKSKAVINAKRNNDFII